jgi:hypothetical protein
MADFSRQYCEQYDTSIPWDFDIEDIAQSLENCTYIPMICEGYGFIAIGKDSNGDTILCFDTDDPEIIEWITIDELYEKRVDYNNNI